MTVGQVLEKSEEELLALRNFGRKCYAELRAKLEELGFLPKEEPEEAMMEAPPLEEEEETPFIVARAGPAPPAEALPEMPTEAAPVPPSPTVEEGGAPPAKETPPPEVEAAGEAALPPVEEGEEELSEWQRKLLRLKEVVAEEGQEEGAEK
jgi:hypothetical protein